MLKRILNDSLLIITLSLFYFIHLVYFGQNRLALTLNQDTSVPANPNSISITKRRGILNILTGLDAHASATCKVSKQDLSAWLKSTGFQVVYWRKDTLSETEFCKYYDSLPRFILNSEIGYTIQLQTRTVNTRHLHVSPADCNTVLLEYDIDWN
jgi:hypothetical protein